MSKRTCTLLFEDGIRFEGVENFRSQNDCEYSFWFLGEYCEVMKDEVLEITWEKLPDPFYNTKPSHPAWK